MKIEVDVEQFARDIKAGKSISKTDKALEQVPHLFLFYFEVIFVELVWFDDDGQSFGDFNLF